jgi:hypothetical protein
MNIKQLYRITTVEWTQREEDDGEPVRIGVEATAGRSGHDQAAAT